MTKGKDPDSTRSRLGEDRFAILESDRYVKLLEIVAGRAPGDRQAAKLDLFDAHLRLVEKKIGEVLRQVRANAGFEGSIDGIGIDGRSDLFNAIAGSVYGELSRMAAAAAKHGFSLSTLIARRVLFRIYDRLRKELADKRTADFDSSDLLNDLYDDAVTGLERLMQDEKLAELRSAIEELPESERLVMMAVHYGIESQQHLPLSRVAESLGMPATTAQSAYQRAIDKLQRRFAPDEVVQNS